MLHDRVIRYLSVWSRAIRTRFLLASLIASINGIAIGVWKNDIFDPVYGLLTICGVICLHISVDLFNDYWDYKKGIDTIARRTKFSGGTGVLPEKLLQPRTVYFAAFMFLILGMIIGIYFITVRGVIILLILIFATISIYFYSTNIANAGLGEVFVTIKGALIVLGSFYVQTGNLDLTAAFVGVIIGLLSACVLLVNSFPDYDADKMGGKKTLTVILGYKQAVNVLPIFLSMIFAMILVGIVTNIIPILSAVGLGTLPLAVRTVKRLKNYKNPNELLLSMTDMILFSRITGLVFALSFIFS
jgi:1,4-dihydroxy-2-naphthoate polyprenyltransferase